MREIAAHPGTAVHGLTSAFLRLRGAVIKADVAVHPVTDGLHGCPAQGRGSEGTPGEIHQRRGVAVTAGVEEGVGINWQSLHRTLPRSGLH